MSRPQVERKTTTARVPTGDWPEVGETVHVYTVAGGPKEQEVIKIDHRRSSPVLTNSDSIGDPGMWVTRQHLVEYSKEIKIEQFRERK